MRVVALPVVYHPDPGPLGQLDSISARALLAEAFAEWASISALSFAEGTLRYRRETDGFVLYSLGVDREEREILTAHAG